MGSCPSSSDGRRSGGGAAAHTSAAQRQTEDRRPVTQAGTGRPGCCVCGCAEASGGRQRGQRFRLGSDLWCVCPDYSKCVCDVWHSFDSILSKLSRPTATRALSRLPLTIADLLILIDTRANVGRRVNAQKARLSSLRRGSQARECCRAERDIRTYTGIDPPTVTQPHLHLAPVLS